MKYACIAEHARDFDISLMCRLLGVSRAGYYAAQQRPPSARARRDGQLTLAIRAVHRASGRCYGAPKVHEQLRADGVRCGRKRVARLMRADGLRGSCRRRFRVTTQSDHAHPLVPNRLGRRFAPAEQPALDRAWVADITYVATREGWLYLAVLLDLASRRVVGWCADAQLDTSLALRALARAVAARRPAPGLVHHSDRGVQYASAEYRAALEAIGATRSMSRKGNCWDNAVAESFFATLKAELTVQRGADRLWVSRAAAQRALYQYIEAWYNPQRLHASLGYRSPVAYEREFTRHRHAA